MAESWIRTRASEDGISRVWISENSTTPESAAETLTQFLESDNVRTYESSAPGCTTNIVEWIKLNGCTDSDGVSERYI